MQTGDFVILRKDTTAYDIGKVCYPTKHFRESLLYIIKGIRLAMKYESIFIVQWTDDANAVIESIDKTVQHVPCYIPCKFLKNPFITGAPEYDESAPD